MNGDDEFGYHVGRVRVLRFTEKAVLVEQDGEERWYPLSQIHDDSEVYDESEVDDEGELVISAWLARKEGLL